MAHVLVAGEDVLPQVPLLLRLKAALVAHEPAAHKDSDSGQGVKKTKWTKFQLKKNRIHHIFSRYSVLSIFKVGFLAIFYFYVRYSTLLHLPPLRFHCVGGCWDRTQDC